MIYFPHVQDYFQPSTLEREQDLIFGSAPVYAGHVQMVPHPNDYFVLPQFHNRFVLFYDGNEYYLLSNICPHRQAPLLTGQGNTKHIICKLHCWSFDINGKLKGAPHFKEKPQAELEKIPLHVWNGLLFKNRLPEFDLKATELHDYINFENYFFAGVESQEYNFNWKTFIEIYQENYHVYSMHPGLKHYVAAADLEWSFGHDFSVQKVGINQKPTQFGTPLYANFQKALLEQFQDKLPRYGALWNLIYPNIMIEWYPHVLVISTINPLSPQKSVNHVEFYYPKDLYQENPEYFHLQKQVYMETAAEDDQACSLLDQGRLALYLNKENMQGHIEPFLEAGVGHFYQFINEKLS
jgi:phenylpropionate dioxygenase-like ring-hydroxylating dioxygenase large terminal subunit